jgi:hypothetical protein
MVVQGLVEGIQGLLANPECSVRCGTTMLRPGPLAERGVWIADAIARESPLAASEAPDERQDRHLLDGSEGSGRERRISATTAGGTRT